MNKIFILLIILSIGLTSCMKDPPIEGYTILLNDSVFFFRTTATYDLDVTMDGKNDVRFNFHSDVAVGGYNIHELNATILNPDIKVAVKTEEDTICKDTVIRAAQETYDYYNNHTSTNIFSIETITYAPWFDQAELNSIPNVFNTNNSVLISEWKSITPLKPFPKANYYNIKKGALKNKSEGYMVFADNKNHKKSLLMKFEGSYIVMVKITNLK